MRSIKKKGKLPASQGRRFLLHRDWPIYHRRNFPIRNTATIGGNICRASPSGETLSPLLVLDAKASLETELPRTKARDMLAAMADFFIKRNN